MPRAFPRDWFPINPSTQTSDLDCKFFAIRNESDADGNVIVYMEGSVNDLDGTTPVARTLRIKHNDTVYGQFIKLAGGAGNTITSASLGIY